MTEFTSTTSSDALVTAAATTTTASIEDTFEALEKRHENERQQLEEETRMMLKTAKKNKKKIIEAQIIQMQFDLKAKHYEEIEIFEVRYGENDKESTTIGNDRKEQDAAVIAADGAAMAAATAVESKKAKAKAKKERKAAKEAELAKERLRIAEENSGPSLRDIELEQINKQLQDVSLSVKSIPSDGNCLYRAIEDQLQNTSTTASAMDHYTLRSLTADHMRRNAEEFCPFLGMEASSEEFQEYCDRVASTSLAEWGGQLELKALAAALKRPIVVYSANAPIITMEPAGDASSASPLRVSYHKHYYALGEHYNSVCSTEGQHS